MRHGVKEVDVLPYMTWCRSMEGDDLPDISWLLRG